MRTSLVALLLVAPLSAVEIVAHRGASFDSPENTVAAMKLAWQQKADCSEFDIYLSKDGKIVVLHDADLKRVAGVDRKIGDLTAAESTALDVGSWKGTQFKGEKLPTLEAMLASVPEGKRVFIEVKCGPEIVPELDRVLKASGLKPEQTAVIAFDSAVIAAMKKARPDILAYWLVSLAAKKDKPSPKVESLIETGKNIKADGLNLSATASVLTPRYAKAIQDAGLKLLVWTVNDANLARQMIALGAIAVTTDRPLFMRERLATDPANVHVMSFNVRYATAEDGDNAWPKRKEFLIETIKTFDPDLLGTQETQPIQKDELVKKLTGHQVFAAGRDDGKESGEMMAVYYRKSRFEKLDGGHFWLSETPDVPGSKSWDSSLPRLATWLKLKDRNAPASEPILFVNTHFDHKGAKARLEAAKLLRTKIVDLGRGCRTIVSGDFNCGEGSEPYKTLFDDKSPVVDSFRVRHPSKGDREGTFNGFKPGAGNGARIDWIGCSPEWIVQDAIIDRTERDGRYPSDHFPIQAVLAPAIKTLRVLTYNIHHGEGSDKKVDLPRVANVIMSAKPDLVAVQEVDNKTRRTGGIDQLAELAKLTGLNGAFGKAIDYDGGEYGQAILSRWPLGTRTVHWLPGEPDRERRIAFEADVAIKGRPMKFVTTHLHHINQAFREQQATKINEIYADVKVPVLVLGDLNATPESSPIAILAKAWTFPSPNGEVFTFPAVKPIKKIDYILMKGADWTFSGQTVIDEAVASDHRPVLAVIDLSK